MLYNRYMYSITLCFLLDTKIFQIILLMFSIQQNISDIHYSVYFLQQNLRYISIYLSAKQQFWLYHPILFCLMANISDISPNFIGNFLLREYFIYFKYISLHMCHLMFGVIQQIF